MPAFQGVHVLQQSRPKPLNLYKRVNPLIKLHVAGLQICKNALSHALVLPMFFYISQVRRIYIYRDLFKEIFYSQSLTWV